MIKEFLLKINFAETPLAFHYKMIIFKQNAVAIHYKTVIFK